MSIAAALRESWGWTEIAFAAVHSVSPMGHLVLSDSEGCYYYLDPELRSIDALGNEEATRTHFAQQETQDIWRAHALVEAARERLGEPPDGSIYTLKPLALLQGDYGYENLCILPLEELIRFTGDVSRQTKDQPERGQYEIKIVE